MIIDGITDKAFISAVKFLEELIKDEKQDLEVRLTAVSLLTQMLK